MGDEIFPDELAEIRVQMTKRYKELLGSPRVCRALVCCCVCFLLFLYVLVVRFVAFSVCFLASAGRRLQQRKLSFVAA